MQPTVYIMASQKNGTLYTGVTGDLVQRVHGRRLGVTPGFTKRYGVTRLVWYGVHERMDAAITAEKRMKRWRRAWKIELIEKANPDWRDLWFEIAGMQPSETRCPNSGLWDQPLPSR
jgi:putative endonuclease